MGFFLIWKLYGFIDIWVEWVYFVSECMEFNKNIFINVLVYLDFIWVYNIGLFLNWLKC